MSNNPNFHTYTDADLTYVKEQHGAMKPITEIRYCMSFYGDIISNTMNSTKKGCIAALISGTPYTWDDLKKFGWKCVKVKVTIEPIN